MDTIDYAFLNSNNEIINLCVIGKDDTETLNSLKDLYGTTNVLVLDEVGHPSYVTDIWDPENNNWIVTEIPQEIPLSPVFIDEENPNAEQDPLL
jgi:hypothetical protein